MYTTHKPHTTPDHYHTYTRSLSHLHQIIITPTPNLHQITITPFSFHAVSAFGVTVPRVTSSQVEYETTAHGSETRVIAGYEVTRFGVPMIGQYVNTGRGRRVTISPAVPGAQYRITAWALGDGRRSATPAVVDVTIGDAGQCIIYLILETFNCTQRCIDTSR